MVDPGAEAVALLSELVAVDSVNPGLVPGAAGETRVVELLSERLHGSGFTVTMVPARGHEDRPTTQDHSSKEHPEKENERDCAVAGERCQQPAGNRQPGHTCHRRQILPDRSKLRQRRRMIFRS